MSTDRERDAAIDHLLRQSVRPDEVVPPGPCPPADALAAMVENELPATERAALDAHVAACDRCQRTLALIVDTPAIQSEGTRVGAGSIWRPRLRWLVPVAAAATALVVYVAIDTNQRNRPTSGQAASPERAAQAIARSAAADQPASGLAAEVKVPSSASQSGRTGARAGGGGGGGAMARSKSIAQNQMARAKALPAPPRKPARDEAPTGAAGKPVAVVAPSQVVAESVIVTQPPAAGVAGAARGGGGRGQAAAVPPAVPPLPVTADKVESRTVAATPPVPPAAAPTRISAVAGGAGRLVSPSAAAQIAPARGGEVIRSTDGAIAWQYGRSGTIAFSRDGGATWQQQVTGVTVDLLAGSAPAGMTCWVVGRSGTVLLTTDGEHWKVRPFPASADLIAVTARDGRNATVTTGDARRFTTTDGGAAWIPARR